jgi:phosphate transport system permease protein
MSGHGLARRKLVERIAVTLCVLALLVALAPLFHVLYTAIQVGGSKLTWIFFSQPAGGLPYIGSDGGVLNGLTGTVILLFIGGLISVPFGVITGMYLADFGSGRLGSTIRAFSDTLLGVPSVIWGLFGFLLFANPISPIGLHLNRSALAGGLTLGLLMIPIVARVTELSLQQVPLGFKESSLALGATRWATMSRIGVRVALPGIVTGVLLALTNAIGQTVALLLTNGYTYFMPRWPLWGPQGNVTDMGSMIYLYLYQPTTLLRAPAEAAVVVLLGLVLIMSLLSRALTALGRRNYAR